MSEGAATPVSIELSEFASAAVRAEADRQDVPREDLLVHAVMYYLADLDSGRLAAKPLKFPPTDQ